MTAWSSLYASRVARVLPSDVRDLARLMGRPGGGWAPHLLLWLGLAGGAVAGAVAFTHLGGSAAWIAFVWAGALALVARRISAAPPA